LVDAINAWLAEIRALREREQRFLADAAHELRTPLAAVQLGAQHLQAALARNDRPQADAALQAVLRGSARSARLAHQLLALLRAEAEASQPLQRIDLAHWLPELIADLAPLAQQRGVQLALAIEPPQALTLQAHPDGLQSLLVNLIDNAIGHAPPGSTVEIGVQRQADRIELSVDDAGPGIPAKQRDSLLQRFRRGQNQPAGSGSGLGLAIAASVAQAHGGSLQLAQAAAGGLRVLVALPAG
jgi:two-component system sensor histidine kinase QseC